MQQLNNWSLTWIKVTSLLMEVTHTSRIPSAAARTLKLKASGLSEQGYQAVKKAL
ncbi:hypothetical protein D3C85_1706350 [compost metagenome]